MYMRARGTMQSLLKLLYAYSSTINDSEWPQWAGIEWRTCGGSTWRRRLRHQMRK